MKTIIKQRKEVPHRNNCNRVRRDLQHSSGFCYGKERGMRLSTVVSCADDFIDFCDKNNIPVIRYKIYGSNAYIQIEADKTDETKANDFLKRNKQDLLHSRMFDN